MNNRTNKLTKWLIKSVKTSVSLWFNTNFENTQPQAPAFWLLEKLNS